MVSALLLTTLLLGAGAFLILSALPTRMAERVIVVREQEGEIEAELRSVSIFKRITESVLDWVLSSGISPPILTMEKGPSFGLPFEIAELVKLLLERHALGLQPASFTGPIRIPKRAYVNQMFHISISLWRVQEQLPGPRVSESKSIAGSGMNVNIDDADLEADLLEIELQAAGLAVEGKKAQKAALNEEPLFFSWNCASKQSEEHEVTFVVSHIREKKRRRLGSLTRKVRVVKIANLTARHAFFLAVLMGAGSVTSGTMTFLHKMKLWPFDESAVVDPAEKKPAVAPGSM